MNWPLFIVQWVHVLLGVLWFGYALSMYFLISPTLMELPEAQGRITNSSLASVGGRVFPIVGLLVLVLGILRGTVFGPINSFEDLFGTTDGWTWLVALTGTVALFYHRRPLHRPDLPEPEGCRRLPRRGRAPAAHLGDRPGPVLHRLHVHDPHAVRLLATATEALRRSGRTR